MLAKPTWTNIESKQEIKITMLLWCYLPWARRPLGVWSGSGVFLIFFFLLFFWYPGYRYQGVGSIQNGGKLPSSRAETPSVTQISEIDDVDHFDIDLSEARQLSVTTYLHSM